MSRMFGTILLCLVTAACASPAQPERQGEAKRAPLSLADQGSFFINARNVDATIPGPGGRPATGHVSSLGMYVQYQIPQALDRNAYPVILVPGASHTSATYETTPDGRMGWAEYFVRKGVPVYVVEQAGRGRSGFDASRAGAPATGGLETGYWRFTNEQAWTIFRFGPTAFVPYEGTQFPIEAQDQYYAQVVPNTEVSYPEGGRNTVEALNALLDRIGPAVVVVHSQSGGYGIRTAIARPDLVKAVVSVEPRSCAADGTQIRDALVRVPLLTVFGDFFGADVDDWPGRMAECVGTVGRIRAAGGRAENIYLPDRSIRGNSHMLMMDRNNQDLAQMILDWVRQNAPKH